MAELDESFLSRWSRLKRAEQGQEPAQQPAQTDVPPEPQAQPALPADVPFPEAVDPNSDLPPLDELDRYSDYTVFMRAGVSPELRKQALAKLWRSDPVFANLDGLLEYGEDYSIPFKRAGIVATAYRVGKGMVDAISEQHPEQESAAPAETTCSSTAEDSGGAPQVDSADANDCLSSLRQANDEDGST